MCVCVCSEDETPSAINTIRITFDNEYPCNSTVTTPVAWPEYKKLPRAQNSA